MGTVPALAAPAPDAIGYVLAGLALILVVARLVGTLLVRWGQPRVVGEMVAGILVGPTLLGGLSAVLYPPASLAFLDLFGQVALALFTFLVGLAVPQHLLRGQVGRVATIGVAVSAASIGLGFALAGVLDEPGVWRVAALADGTPVPVAAHALFVGAAVTASALPVIARILQDRGIQETRVGAMGIGATAVVTVLTFLVVAAGSAVLDGNGAPSSTGLRFAGTVLLVAVLFGMVRPVLARVLARRFRPAEGVDGGLLTILLAGALLTALAASVLGIRGFTGGLLFGAAVPQVPGLAVAVGARLQQFVVVVGIPVFLAASGLHTDLRLVRLEHLGVLALFLAAIAVGKWGVGTVVGRTMGMTGRDAGAVGVLVSCGGLVTLVVALAGRELGLVTPSMQVVLALVAIVSTLLTGPLLELFLRTAPDVLSPVPVGMDAGPDPGHDGAVARAAASSSPGPVVEVRHAVETPREFFDRYRAEWLHTRDGGRVAAFHSAPCLTLCADGSFHALDTTADVAAFLQNVIDLYRQQGMTDIAIEEFEVRDVGGRSALATMDWVARRGDATVLRRWRQSYNLVSTAEGWKIVLSTFHVDAR